MAGKRRCAVNENRPKTNSNRKKKKDQASITSADKALASSHKKQTSLLSFWGKNIVRTKTTTKTAVTNAAQCPTQNNVAKNKGRAIIVTTSSKLESKNESESSDKKNFNGDGKYTKDKVRNQNQKSTENNENKGIERFPHRDANLGNSMEITLNNETTSVSITPCKSPLSSATEKNEDRLFLAEEKNDDDKGESKCTEPNNDANNTNNSSVTFSLSAPIHLDNDAPRSPPQALSEYEQLRLRNIERNNARLAALGLLTTAASNRSHSGSSSNRRCLERKRPKIHPRIPQQPLRRSSRNRNPKPETRNACDGDIANSATSKSETIEEPETEEEEYYTVSPLLQYEMSRTERSANSNAFAKYAADSSIVDNTTTGLLSSSSNMCLAVTGPRFVPPKGLSAIYSLEFWGNSGVEASSTSNSGRRKSNWLVGAGKAGLIALWDTNTANDNDGNTVDEAFVDPVLSWKAHNGRWIADAKFLSSSTKTMATEAGSTETPSRLVSAGNDGTVCLWDLSTVSYSTGEPKLLHRTGKSYHGSGIFCMNISSSSLFPTSSSSDGSNRNNENSSDVMICTGSKDKSVAVSSLGSLQAAGSTGEPLWRSQFHTAKVGAVKLKGRGSTILASASDDGLVALHDFRANGCGRTSESYSSSLVAKLEDAHDRPHSVLWDRSNEFVFVTAGLDPIVKVWDQRNLSKPVACLQGHVPTSTSRCKRIHRPVFFDPSFLTPTYPKQFTGPRVCPFLLTGGQGSASVSVYKLGMRRNEESLFSRGKLPVDCGDSGCIAVNGKQVAVAVDQGEIMILEPSSAQ
jgi:hypothetical protein